MISSAAKSSTAIEESTAACLNCGSMRNTPWAEASDVEYRTSEFVFRYLHCVDCDVLFIVPRPQDLAEIYPPNYYSYAEPGHSFAARVKARLERRMFAGILRQLPGEQLSV